MPDQRALLLGRLASAIDGVADVASRSRRPGDRDQGAGSSEAASRVGWPALDPGSGHGADCHAGPRTWRPDRRDIPGVAPRRAATTPRAPPLQDAAGHRRIEHHRAHPRLAGRGPLPERTVRRPGPVRGPRRRSCSPASVPWRRRQQRAGRSRPPRCRSPRRPRWSTSRSTPGAPQGRLPSTSS